MLRRAKTVINRTQKRLSTLRAHSALTREVERRVHENDELRTRLEEAEQTMDAIRNGEIDAIVTSGKDAAVYTLEGPDHPYRNIVETMNAGAVTIDRGG